MELSQTIKELRDAGDLLKMIDCLICGISGTSQGSISIPWSGIQMTLDQIQDIVVRNSEQLARIDGSISREQSVDSLHVRPEPAPVRTESLANRVDRVKQVASGQARARELLNNIAPSAAVVKDKTAEH